MPRRLARRTFLRGLGGVAVALPFLDAMKPSGARGDVPPRRYVQLFTPLGFSPGQWYTPSGAEGFTIQDFAAPLRPHAADLLLVRGLRGWNGADGHHAGVGAVFTGASEDSVYDISLDQAIADLLSPMPFRSLHFGFFTPTETDAPGETHTTFAGPGRPISPEASPRTMFSTLFGSSTGSDEAIAAALARRQSVLDLVRDDFADVQVGLSAADRRRLSQHAEFLRSVEMTISAMGASCSTPVASNYDIALDESQGARISRAQSDLLVLALACNLTQVVTMQWSFSVNGITYPWLESRKPGISEKNHHGWTHWPSTGDWSTGLPYFREIERWYIEEVGYVLDQLKALDLFSNTLVLWATNEPRGQHGADEEGREDRMYVLAGSLGGYYRTGRVVDFQVDGYLSPDERWDYSPALLLNVAKAFGYTGTTFGSSYYNQAGPSPGLTVAG